MYTMKRASVEEEYRKNAGNLKKEDVMDIIQWSKTQPHLPDVSEFEAILFLHSNYYDLERAKKTIDNYFTMRTKSPDFFSSRDVTTDDMQETLRIYNVGLLPQRTKEGYTVIIIKLRETDPKLSTNANNVKMFMMLFDILLLEEGTHAGLVFVFDMEGASWGHFLKASFSESRRQMQYVQEGCPVRLKAMCHFHVPSFMDTVLQIFKPLMSENILKMISFAKTIEETYEQIPAECYPSDYPNGKGPSFDELHEELTKKLLAYKEYFEEEERTKRVDESKRPKKKSFWNIF